MLYELRDLRSRAASGENPEARAGAGGAANRGRKGAPCIWPLKQGQTYTLLDTDGPEIVHIWCTLPPGNVDHLRNVILRMYWDGQSHPSVEAPLGDFFGVSHGRQRSTMGELVAMQVGKGFNCWIPMPFRSHARITVKNDSTAIANSSNSPTTSPVAFSYTTSDEHTDAISAAASTFTTTTRAIKTSGTCSLVITWKSTGAACFTHHRRHELDNVHD